MQNQHEEELLSQEELAKRKEEMLSFYTDSLPYLEAQLKYEDLLYKIDEARFKRTNIQIQYAMMLQGREEAEAEAALEKENANEESPVSERKLKKG